MTGDAAILDAGGITAGRPAAGRSDVDTVMARRYAHEVLPDDRVVVRLVPAALGEAEDLAMEFLGFTAAGAATPVGTGVRQALGFPAWALINDPANGRHALAMVKEMERLARVAKAKPGNAKEGYEELAARLGNAAPHFLPTYWEQAGRAFVGAENAKMAGICFTKARDAEQVHALAIDEGRLAEVHLEFALAGALPGKALQQYARGLAARLAPDAAYRQLRAVAIQRVAGGLAPHAGMADDLSRLAKAAGLDPNAEAERVVGELLALPAVAKASLSFWKSHRGALVRLAKREPAVRGRLLAIMPDPPGWHTDIGGAWIELLDATGASAGLVGDVEPAAAPEGGATGWLERFVVKRNSIYGRKRCPQMIQFVERMAPALRAAVRPVRAHGDNIWRADLDVIDAVLAAGVEVPAVDSGDLDVAGWLADPSPGHRDLVALAAHPGLARPWRQGIRHALRHHRFTERGAAIHPEHLARFCAVPGVRSALVARLDEAADAGDDQTLAGLGDLIDELAPLHSPDGAAIAPGAVRRIAAADVAQALARTLRTGLPGELGWPAYDDALSRLSTDDLQFSDAWPHLIVCDAVRAVVIGPEGVVHDHVAQVPTATTSWHRRPQYSYVDGQLLVTWHDNGQRWAYWSARPSEVFEPGEGEAHIWLGHSGVMGLPLAGGGVTTGARPWHVGDRDIPARYRLASDGVDFWRLQMQDRDYSSWAWHEFDPATGTGGRRSRPRFLEEAGDGLVEHTSMLLPVPGLTASPLGCADGLVGWRARQEPDGVTAGEGIDGRTVRLPLAHLAILLGAVTVPGASQPRPLTSGHAYHGRPRLSIHEPGSGRVALRWLPGRTAPPHEWWHWLRARDEAGSQALRAVSAEVAAALLKAFDAGTGAPADAARAVAEVLPDITDATLRESVAEALVEAARQARWLAAFGDHLDTAPATLAQSMVDDALLETGTAGLAAMPFYSGHVNSASTLPAILEVGRLLTGAQPDGRGELNAIDWPHLLGAEGAIALRATSPAFPAPEREALLALLDTISAAGLLTDRATLRVLTLEAPREPRPRTPDVLRDGDQVTVTTGTLMLRWDTNIAQIRAVGRAPSGTFGPVAGFDLTDDRRPGGWATPDRVAALIGLATARGPWPWRPELVAGFVERTGSSPAEAALLLAGLPGSLSRSANFLPTETRQLLGLSVAEARTARDALHRLTADQRTALLDAAVPADPAELWERGPDLDRLAAAWIGFFGARRAVPEEVLIAANKAIPGRDALDIVSGLVNPETCPWLAPGQLRADLLPGLAVAVPWLAYRLPAGDPVTAGLVEGYGRLREALRSPELTIEVYYVEQAALDLPAVSARPVHGGYFQHTVHADRVDGPDDPALLRFTTDPKVLAMRLLLSEQTAALVAALAAERPGQRSHDPRDSVPDLVAEVVAAHGLGTDAAAHYLQLLALPDPTDRNVMAWTGWTAGTIKQLRAELVAAGLVIEAKRDRAGRSAFLPGGWLALRAPDLPVEQWKSSLYGPRLDSAPPPSTVMVLTPVPELFRVAWQRVLDGDAPTFQSLEEAR
jgi:hypothetical protein